MNGWTRGIALSLLSASSILAKPISSGVEPWTIVSIPDFLNFDIEYPQKGWEDALGFIVGSMKREDPAFAMVAGDLVMGHWGTKKEEINKWADKYYPGWFQRFKDHELKVYAALGDHEIITAIHPPPAIGLRHLRAEASGLSHDLGRESRR